MLGLSIPKSIEPKLEYLQATFGLDDEGLLVTVVNKKVESDITFGLRTVDITAKSPTEYTAIDEIFTIKKREPEKTIPISIIDNSDWQPDLEFKVELYDPETKEPLFGGDT